MPEEPPRPDRPAAPSVVPQHQAEAHLRSLMDTAEEFVLYRIHASPDRQFGGTVVLVSANVRDVLGIDDPLDFPSWFKNIHPDDLPAVVAANARAGETGEPFVAEMRIVHPGGETRWIRALSRAAELGEGQRYYNGLILDITDLRRAEEERRLLESRVEQAQRLDGLGLLAGGIAHDFNNLLQAIVGNAELALHDLAPDAPGRAAVAQVVEAIGRARELADQLLAYSGGGRQALQPVDLNEVVRDTAGVMRAVVTRNARLELRLSAEALWVDADPGQLGQVVMNLLTNAAEAIGDRPGEITLRTGEIELTADALREFDQHEGCPPGRAVLLDVDDDGCGMDDATRGRVFDPFFTTKFTGRGLGMAAVHGIVRSHRGAIRVQSRPAEGTSVRIVLPPSSHLAETAPGRGGDDVTVLVVDDEEAVRKVTQRMLEGSGYRVLVVPSGEAALGLLERGDARVDAVLLDITMPGLGGIETLRLLRERVGAVPVVLTSGLRDAPTPAELGGDVDAVGFVQKPYRAADLVAQLRRMLER